VDFLSRQNGAMLFSGALNLYGVVQPGQLLNRSDNFSLPPFNIERENDSWVLDKGRLLVVGSYRFDGARACIDRLNSQILVFKKRGNTPIASWSGIEDWVIAEVARLSTLFNNEGKRIGLESEIGPPVRSR
jgi:hypothetical protein